MLQSDIIINRTERRIINIILDYSENNVPQSVFASRKNSTVKKALKSLLDKGLIKKKFNSLDMRRRFIVLTDVGVAQFEENSTKRFT